MRSASPRAILHTFSNPRRLAPSSPQSRFSLLDLGLASLLESALPGHGQQTYSPTRVLVQARDCSKALAAALLPFVPHSWLQVMK